MCPPHSCIVSSILLSVLVFWSAVLPILAGGEGREEAFSHFIHPLNDPKSENARQLLRMSASLWGEGITPAKVFPLLPPIFGLKCPPFDFNLLGLLGDEPGK